jgi:hypothetical protein
LFYLGAESGGLLTVCGDPAFDGQSSFTLEEGGWGGERGLAMRRSDCCFGDTGGTTLYEVTSFLSVKQQVRLSAESRGGRRMRPDVFWGFEQSKGEVK